MQTMQDLDPLNSPSRDSYHQVESTSPFSRMFSSSSISEPPLIDFTSSPSPPRQSHSHPFIPLPLSLASRSHESLFPPSSSTCSNSRPSSSPLKFSILEDSFSDLPPSFPSALSQVQETEEAEGGLVSFIQDSPPPSALRRTEKEKENVSPTRRKSGASGRKWGVMQRLKEDHLRRRSTSLSPVKEAGGASPYSTSTREGDSIAQISEVDLSLIQDEAGSFLLPDDDSTTGQSFEAGGGGQGVPDPRGPGDLSQIGEEEEEEAEIEEVSVGLDTMFLVPRIGQELDVSQLGDQSKFVPFHNSSRGGKNPVFDQSTLPRSFPPPPPSSSIVRSNSSSILPPELVSPMKSSRVRPTPSSSYLPTPDPSPLLSTDQPLPFDQSSLSFSIHHQPQQDHSFLNKSSISFVKECKTPRTVRRQGRVSDSSIGSNTSGSSGISREGGGEGEITDFGFTQFGFGREGETSTAILEQLPPTSVFNPESTRTIELCLQPPLLPTHNEEDDLASSTRTVKASDYSKEEIDLMGMEEPSMFLRSNESGVGEMTMELTESGGGEVRETGAERLKRRMKELRAAQTQESSRGTRSLYTIPSTPSTMNSNGSRFVSLLDQTPQPQPQTQRRKLPSTVIQRQTPAPTRSSQVGTLISFDTPSTRQPKPTLSTPAPSSSTTRPIKSRSSFIPPPSRPTIPEAPKTPGERKESTRARLERMRSERKVREEETLGLSTEKGGVVGLKRSNSVGTRLTGKAEVGAQGGMTRSRSTTGVGSAKTTTSTLADRMLASKPSSTSTTSRQPESKPPAAAPRKSTISMPPPSLPSTSTRRSSLVPSSSTSRLVKRPSLLPTSASTSSLSSIGGKREPLRPTTAVGTRQAGTGSRK